MTVLAICPYCLRTIRIESDVSACPECGHKINAEEINKKNLLIDSATEAQEFALGKDFFANTEFMSAMQHFDKALAANKNSYLSQYFLKICDIYIHESTRGFDIMQAAVDTISSSLELLARSGVSVSDKLTFITAMINETKIIILNRLRSHLELFDTDIEAYRKEKIADLSTLRALFKIDGELLMTYSPNIASVLSDIADCAVMVCHKTVQTVAIGEELHVPTEEEYKELTKLNNDFCFFASSLSPDYDAKKYTPDFDQNVMLIEKVNDRLVRFDAKNKSNAKRFIIGDIEEYENIIAECELALEFTYRTCFKSLCDRKYYKRTALLKDGLQLLYRILTPRVRIVERKKADMTIGKFVDVSEKYVMLSKFLTDAAGFDSYALESLRAFYTKLYDIVDMYFTAEFDKYTKLVDKLKQTRDDDFKYYCNFLLNTACCCAVALNVYVPFDTGKDKSRYKLVRLCKQASEEFLLLWDYKVDELDQSNLYRPILDIYNAVLKECDE